MKTIKNSQLFWLIIYLFLLVGCDIKKNNLTDTISLENVSSNGSSDIKQSEAMPTKIVSATNLPSVNDEITGPDATLTPVSYPLFLLEGKLYITSFFDGPDTRIYELSKDSGLLEILKASNIVQFSVSKDGDNAVFIQRDDKDRYLRNMYHFDLESSEWTLLDQYNNECPWEHLFSGLSFVDWAYDQNSIIYEKCGELYPQIAVFDFSTNTTMNITHTESANFSPVVSPTGNQIAFLSDRTGTLQVFTMHEDGTQVQQLTNLKDDGYINKITWSPDGTKLAFWYSSDGYDYEIYSVNSDGTMLTSLISSETYDSVSIGQIAWSQSGTELLFINAGQVYVVNINTHEVIQLTEDGGRKEYPIWSIDGQDLIYIESGNDVSYVIYQDLDGEFGRQVIQEIKYPIQTHIELFP